MRHLSPRFLSVTLTLGLWLAARSTALFAAETAPVTGARVPEERVQAIFHVAANNAAAADDNPGTAERPFKTLGRALAAALENNAKNIATKVSIAPGIYRERLSLRFTGRETEAPLVFEATEKGKAVVSGSDVWTDWKREADGSYSHAWPHKWGLAPVPDGWGQYLTLQPLVRRREMVFAGGRPLQQELAAADLKVGGFFVDEANATLRLRLPADADPNRTVMEVATRSALWDMEGKKNVVLRGLTFQHDNTPIQGSAVSFSHCSNLLLEDCRLAWNNWGGLGFGESDNVTLRRCVSSDNGGTGIGGWKLQNQLWEDCETSRNNWRGVRGEFTGWAVAGVKLLFVHGGLYRRHTATDNHAVGFWFDSDCADVMIEGARWTRNLGGGMFIEACQGPVTVQNSAIWENGSIGVLTATSSRVFLLDNVLYGNAGSQVSVAGHDAREVENFRTGEKMMLKDEKMTLRDNVLAGKNSTQNVIDLWKSDERFLSSLTAERNLYFNPQDSGVFKMSGAELSFADWQTGTGQDLNSRFADPRFTAPQEGRFEPKANSPLLQKASWPRRTNIGPRGDFTKFLSAARRQEIERNWNTPYPVAAQVPTQNWVKIDLKPFANRPLTGQNSWIGIPLENFEPGLKKIQGVPFQTLDAAIALRSLKIKETKGQMLPSQVAIPLGRKARAVYFLHGSGYSGEHRQFGEYRFVYEDGSSVAVPLIPFGQGSEHMDVLKRLEAESTIQDWWPAMPQFEGPNARKVIVASQDKPLDGARYLYTLQWLNPHPEKSIREIRLSSQPEREATVFVLAITSLETR